MIHFTQGFISIKDSFQSRRFRMNKSQLLLSSAVASVIALGLADSAQAAEGKEKCYGVSKAGKNDCATKNGSHSCAGQSKADNDGNEWMYLAKGKCEKIGGSTKPIDKK